MSPEIEHSFELVYCYHFFYCLLHFFIIASPIPLHKTVLFSIIILKTLPLHLIFFTYVKKFTYFKCRHSRISASCSNAISTQFRICSNANFGIPGQKRYLRGFSCYLKRYLNKSRFSLSGKVFTCFLSFKTKSKLLYI